MRTLKCRMVNQEEFVMGFCIIPTLTLRRIDWEAAAAAQYPTRLLTPTRKSSGYPFAKNMPISEYPDLGRGNV